MRRWRMRTRRKAPTRCRPGPISCSSTAASASSMRRRRCSRTSASTTPVPLVGIAKGPDRDAGRETFFMEGREPFMLPQRDPVLYFVQRLRDEAHRFAIGTHRARRKKEMAQQPARRDRRHRPDPQARAAAPFRHRQGGEPRRACRPDGGGGHFRTDGPGDLRPFPREWLTKGGICADLVVSGRCLRLNFAQD